MPGSIVIQASGPVVERSQAPSNSDTAAQSSHVKAMTRHTQLIRQSEFPDFVFTSLSEAIREWKGTCKSPAFNLLATVNKWSQPKPTKGVNSSIVLAQETNMWFQGSDMQFTATLWSNESDRNITASFFFDPKKCPKIPVVGEKVRLLGVQLQQWQGCEQLTGKNIRFGHSCVCISLTNAIELWEHTRRVQPLLFLRKRNFGAQRHFPTLTMIVIVKTWGKATRTSGAQVRLSHRCCITYSCVFSGRDVHIVADFSCPSNVNTTIRGSFFFDPLLQPKAFSVGDFVELIGIEMQEWQGSPQLSGKNVQIDVPAVSSQERPPKRLCS